jgi:hypothetical protein
MEDQDQELREHMDSFVGQTISSFELDEDEDTFFVKCENGSAFTIGMDDNRLCFVKYELRPQVLN